MCNPNHRSEERSECALDPRRLDVANEAGQIQFRLNPTAATNGLDFVTSSGPVYLDLTRNADRTQTQISFVREGEPRISAHDPVAIDVNVIR